MLHSNGSRHTWHDRAGRDGDGAAVLDGDIVVPVYNEIGTLDQSVRRFHLYRETQEGSVGAVRAFAVESLEGLRALIAGMWPGRPVRP